MILVDATHAVMEPADLQSLADYSCSIPTGTTAGKRWKRRCDFYNESAGWMLGEYGEPVGDRVPIIWREVLLVEGKGVDLAPPSAAAQDTERR